MLLWRIRHRNWWSWGRRHKIVKYKAVSMLSYYDPYIPVGFIYYFVPRGVWLIICKLAHVCSFISLHERGYQYYKYLNTSSIFGSVILEGLCSLCMRVILTLVKIFPYVQEPTRKFQFSNAKVCTSNQVHVE